MLSNLACRELLEFLGRNTFFVSVSIFRLTILGCASGFGGITNKRLVCDRLHKYSFPLTKFLNVCCPGNGHEMWCFYDASLERPWNARGRFLQFLAGGMGRVKRRAGFQHVVFVLCCAFLRSWTFVTPLKYLKSVSYIEPASIGGDPIRQQEVRTPRRIYGLRPLPQAVHCSWLLNL